MQSDNHCLEQLVRILPSELNLWVFASHPDDEVLGCGGIMAKYPNNFFSICVTDGGGSKGAKGEDKEERRKIVQQRKKDDVLGLMNLGVCNSLYLNHREIKTEQGMKNFGLDLEVLLKRRNPQYIFVHSPYEFISRYEEVPDVLTHRLVTEVLVKTLRKTTTIDLRLLGYEVWDDIPKGQGIMIEDITEQIDFAKAAMTAHRTERVFDFIGMKEGKAKNNAQVFINRPTSIQYAEKFLDMTPLLDSDVTLEEYRLYREQNASDYNPQINFLNGLKGG